MNSSALTVFNRPLKDIITSIVDKVIPAGGCHDAILALLIYCAPFVFAALAFAFASCNPAESQRRGLWVVPADLPWDIKYIRNGQLSWCNALKQQGWQILAAATDSWSCHHNNADYQYRGSPFTITDVARHSLPFAWGYTDVAKPEDLNKKVNMESTHLRYISAKRGRVEGSLNVGVRRSLVVIAYLCTSSLNINPRAARNLAPTRRRYSFTVVVHPVLTSRLVSSWRDSIFNASVIIGLWMAAVTCAKGVRGWEWALIGCPLFGWIAKRKMVSTDIGKENLLSALPEVGKKIILDDSLASIGGGVLEITANRQTAQLQVQWRRPNIPPDYPWFGVFCGPLFPSLSLCRYLYSFIMLLSGTLSPPVRATCGKNFLAFACLIVVLAKLILGTLGFSGFWIVVLFLGVGIHLLLAISLCHIMIPFSHPDVQEVAEWLTFVGWWTIVVQSLNG
ncbi:hypothetical protein TRVA0_061S00694 [Trichomonascus vanleenenianus]|uniref:uncharacterized protein n=1 Tax=Trichomonascus vanleenenianus TaxID=2268995 RepID=UPI003ECB2BAE